MGDGAPRGSCERTVRTMGCLSQHVRGYLLGEEGDEQAGKVDKQAYWFAAVRRQLGNRWMGRQIWVWAASRAGGSGRGVLNQNVLNGNGEKRRPGCI